MYGRIGCGRGRLLLTDTDSGYENACKNMWKTCGKPDGVYGRFGRGSGCGRQGMEIGEALQHNGFCAFGGRMEAGRERVWNAVDRMWKTCGEVMERLGSAGVGQHKKRLNGQHRSAVFGCSRPQSLAFSCSYPQIAVLNRSHPYSSATIHSDPPTSRSLTPSARFPPGRPPASRPRKRWCPRSWCTPHRRGGGICPAGPAQGRGGPASPVLSAS